MADFETGNDLRQWRGQGLFFLAGAARSGTTFLGRLLGSHPAIGYWEEPRLLELVGRLRQPFAELIAHMAVDARLQTIDADRKGHLRQQFGAHLGIGRQEARQASLSHLRGILYRLVADFSRLAGKPNVLDKTPRALRLFRFGGQLVPEARFIHIVRDPRDVICSQRAWVDRTGKHVLPESKRQDVSTLAQRWATKVGFGLALEDYGSALHLMRLKYESLVGDPRPVLTELLGFLGLGWSPEIDSFLDRGMGDGLDTKSVGRWGQELSGPDLEIVLRQTGDLFERLGYTK
jgi:hypothetical protein